MVYFKSTPGGMGPVTQEWGITWPRGFQLFEMSLIDAMARLIRRSGATTLVQIAGSGPATPAKSSRSRRGSAKK